MFGFFKSLLFRKIIAGIYIPRIFIDCISYHDVLIEKITYIKKKNTSPDLNFQYVAF